MTSTELLDFFLSIPTAMITKQFAEKVYDSLVDDYLILKEDYPNNDFAYIEECLLNLRLSLDQFYKDNDIPQ